MDDVHVNGGFAEAIEQHCLLWGDSCRPPLAAFGQFNFKSHEAGVAKAFVAIWQFASDQV